MILKNVILCLKSFSLGYTGLLCEMDINECNENRMACGRSGTCENMPGSYRCICDNMKGKCGHQCDLDDPCEIENPCVHGTCHSQCTDKPDYICVCEENFTGKNCTDIKVSVLLMFLITQCLFCELSI